MTVNKELLASVTLKIFPVDNVPLAPMLTWKISPLVAVVLLPGAHSTKPRFPVNDDEVDVEERYKPLPEVRPLALIIKLAPLLTELPLKTKAEDAPDPVVTEELKV